MKRCQRCGHSNDDNARFCSGCGQSFEFDKRIEHAINTLNSRSSSKEIYSNLKSFLNEECNDIVKVNDEIRGNFEQSASNTHAYILPPPERDYWALLNKATRELLDIKMASEALTIFFLSISMASYRNLDNAKFQVAVNQLFDEFGNNFLRIQSSTLEKLYKTLIELHSTFVPIARK